MKHSYHIAEKTDLSVIQSQARKSAEGGTEVMIHHHRFEESCLDVTHEFLTGTAHDKFTSAKEQLNPGAETRAAYQTPIIDKTYILLDKVDSVTCTSTDATLS